MKNQLLILIALFITVMTTQAHAGWTGPSKVTQIVVVATGGINVRLSPELTGCESQSGYGPAYASVYPDHPGLNAIHSNLLAAFMSGKDVRLYFSPNSGCKVGEMRLQ